MTRLFHTALLATALLVPVAFTPTALRAEDRKSFHDKKHNDDHEWNNHEDQAYRMWAKEKHRKYVEFNKAKESDRQAYWAWRHDHSDALLKIDIR